MNLNEEEWSVPSLPPPGEMNLRPCHESVVVSLIWVSGKCRRDNYSSFSHSPQIETEMRVLPRRGRAIQLFAQLFLSTFEERVSKDVPPCLLARCGNNHCSHGGHGHRHSFTHFLAEAPTDSLLRCFQTPLVNNLIQYELFRYSANSSAFIGSS